MQFISSIRRSAADPALDSDGKCARDGKVGRREDPDRNPRNDAVRLGFADHGIIEFLARNLFTLTTSTAIA
jgi:hypothetical protein